MKMQHVSEHNVPTYNSAVTDLLVPLHNVLYEDNISSDI